MKLSVIFEEKPKKLGFRGDPYFRDPLKKPTDDTDIISPGEPESRIKNEYISLSGKPLTGRYMDIAVTERFAHGGISSGGIYNTRPRGCRCLSAGSPRSGDLHD